MVKYVFRDDDVLTIKNKEKANPQKIGEALEIIGAKAGGRLQPGAVVDAARDRKSALHPFFEWDNQIAAEAYRLDQARGLIRCIHVETNETDSGYARAYLSIKDAEGQSYRAISDVLSSSDLQSRVLAAAERDLLAFERRYRDLGDICGLIRSIREQVAERRATAQSDRRISA